MTVTIFGLSNGQHISPGNIFFWTCSGPTAIDDHINAIPSVNAIGFDIVCRGANSGFLMVGYEDTSTLFKFAANVTPPLVSGATWDWTIARYNRAGSFLEGGPTVTGIVYSPDVYSCFNLLSYLNGSNSQIADIYNSVHRLYPAT